MPSPEPQPSGQEQPTSEPRPDAWAPGAGSHSLGSANTDLIQLVAAAADLCRKPLRHGVVALTEAGADASQPLEVSLRLEARTPAGERRPEQDLELEIYPSGSDLNLTLAWCQDESLPMLWQGMHPVWMDASGARCQPPPEASPIEALARRLRALLVGGLT